MADILPPGETTPVMTTPHRIIGVEPAAPKLVVHPHPFARGVEPRFAAEGATVAEIVRDAALPEHYWSFIRVWVDDVEVPRELWARVRPKAGRHIYVRVTPHGGGDGGKNVLASVLMLIVVAASAVFAPMIAGALLPGLTGVGLKVATSLIGAGLSMVGALLINGLIPPPNQGDGLVGQRALLSGVRNQFAPYAEIPRIFGRRRVYPMQAARPYTEAVGKDRYLRVLLAVGWGPLQISDIRIGDTPIGNFANIEVQTREGWINAHSAFGAVPSGKLPEPRQTLFTKAVFEEGFNVVLEDAGLTAGNDPINSPGPWVVRTTDTETEEISVDVTFPLGLAQFEDDGGTDTVTLEIEVQYRKVGTTPWLSVEWAGNDEEDGTQTDGKIIAKDRSRVPTIRGGRWITGEAAQYQVRLRRITPRKTPTNSYSQRIEWTALRSIRYENPIATPGLALIALRIKATDQFSSIPDSINCVAHSFLPVWNGTAWNWGLSRSPGWAYADLMRRRGNERIIPDSRIDIPTIRSWAVACSADAPNVSEPYWAFDAIFEKGAIFTCLRQAAAHGRASFVISDGKYSVVRDVAQTVPVQHITPRNSWGYSGTKAFVDRPHALKVGFINAAAGYQEDEVIVYDDGFDETNATIFESFDLPGCTSRTQAWREGRYQLAVGQLRPEEHVVFMDVEALRCTMGDYVLFSNDALSIGIGSGRITARTTSAGNILSVTIDQEVRMVAGVDYSLRVRLANGATALYPVQPVGDNGNYTTITLATPVPVSGNANVGDLFMFGRVTREAAPMIVKRIEPGPNLTAKLTLVDAQPGVWTADTRPIPNFQTYITDDTPIPQARPSAPSFTLKSDETVIERVADGTLQDRIAVTITPPASSKVRVGGYDVQWREFDRAEWLGVNTPAGQRTVFIAPVVQGRAYDIRVRSISIFGETSNWVVANNHVVIGKTTPPQNVTGFQADALVNGVQLSWVPNPEIDVIGYEIRRGTSWATATLVSRRVTGNSFFVAISTATPQTFLIRAIDAIGLQSPAPAQVVASVAAPQNVTSFEAYPQGDNIQFRWRPVPGDGIEYEIRNGPTWAESRRVARATGNQTTVQWPIRVEGSPLFWIKARSPAGVFSATAFFTSILQAPIPNRNVILDTDFSADTYASGVRVGLATSGSGLGSLLQIATAPDGLYWPFGRFSRRIDIGANLYSRNWAELGFTASAGSTLTWSGATFTWEQAGAATWLGTISDDATADIEPFISIEDATANPASLVEGWRMETSLVGTAGTPPTSGSGMVYAPCHFTNGLDAAASANVTWNRDLGSVLTFAIDFRRSGSMADSFTVATLRNVALWLRLGWDGATQSFIVVGSDGATLSVPFEVWADDVVTLAVAQGAATRHLFVASVRNPVVASASGAHAPVGTLNRINLFNPIGPASPKAPGRLGDAELHNTAFDAAAFAAFFETRKPLGHRAFKPLSPGDYEYQRAIIQLRYTNEDRSILVSGNTLKHLVDVPDVDQRGTVSVAAGGTAVTFPVPFNAPPEVVVTQKGGAVLAISRITAGPTATGFTVRLFDATSPTTGVAGTISYSAKGY